MASGVAEEKGEVDRAAVGVRRAIGRLIALLGSDDQGEVAGAAVTLISIGAFAAGPLAAALPRARSVAHRAGIMTCLMELSPVARAGAMRAMSLAMRREPDDHLRASACRCFGELVAASFADGIARRRGTSPTTPVVSS
jgi:hypothetical protein